MKNLLFLFFVLFSFKAYGYETVVIGIRGNEAASKWFASSLDDAVLAEEKTREFETSTTDVHIETPLANKSVVIVLPRSFTPNTLMEALIKTRIAKSSGARSIEIDSPSAISTIDVLDREGSRIFLPIASMFAIAGAEFVNEQGGIRTGLSPENMDLFKKVEATQSYIVGDEHPELRDELSDLLKLPVLSVTKKNLSGAHIFYIAPFMAPVNENFFKQMSKMRYLITLGARVHLISPYFIYPRFDRTSGPGTTVAGQLAVNLMESFGADGTIFVHAHARQSEGFFQKPFTHLSGRKSIIPLLRKLKIKHVVAPDNSALKDATELAAEFGASIGGINKRRIGAKEVKIVGIIDSYLEGKKVSLKGEDIVMPDDEGGTGVTLDKGGSELKRRRKPKRIIAAVMHTTGSISAVLNSKVIDRYLTLNTLPIPDAIRSHKMVTVGSVAPEIAEGILPFVRRSAPVGCSSIISEFKAPDAFNLARKQK